VSESISDKDFQTHFDLGIAYREMDLLDDAVSEFELCSQLPGKKVMSLYQIGLCEVQRENFDIAKDYFDKALQDPNLVDQEKLSISYELAEVLLRLDDRSQASKLFEEVKKLDPDFRDVQIKLQECQA